MLIELETDDGHLPFDLLGWPESAADGTTAQVEKIGTLRLDYWPVRKSLGPQIVSFSFEFVSGVAAGVVANWLYNKFSGRVSKLRIDRIDVLVEEGEIRRVISERIEVSE